MMLDHCYRKLIFDICQKLYEDFESTHFQLSWDRRLSLDVIPEVEERPVNSKKVGSLLILCCKKPLLDLCRCFQGLMIGFGSTPQGVRLVLKFSQKAEKSLYSSIKVTSWL